MISPLLNNALSDQERRHELWWNRIIFVLHFILWSLTLGFLGYGIYWIFTR